MISRFGRCLVYLWVLPTSFVASPFVVGAIIEGRARIVDGVLEIHGGLARFWLQNAAGLVLRGGASAMTLGHVVLGVDQKALDQTRFHERIHVRQCEWFGPFFLPAYLLSSLLLWMSGKDAYRQNPFERQAFRAAPAGSERHDPGGGRRAN